MSCERVFDPTLRNKPVVVLSSGDACIIARSNEAKALGIPMGAAVFEWEDVLKKNNVIVHSANFALYGDMSARVMQTLTAYASDIEIYSVDEAFLFVSDYNFPIRYDKRYYYTAYGHHLRNQVKQCTGIPASIGIGPTKTLAKVANHFAKKNPAYDGVFDITERSEQNELLAMVPVGDVWGIGYRYAKKLKNKGILTAYDFTQLDDVWVRKNMTIGGLKTLHELRGIPCLDLELTPEPRQSICVSRLFGAKTKDLVHLKEGLASYVSTASVKLRAQKALTSRLMVFAVTNRYHEPHNYFASMTLELPLATAYTPMLITAALEGLQKIYKPGLLYKKVGVVLMDLVPDDCMQLDTYTPLPDLEKQKNIIQLIDRANSRWGRNKISFAATGFKQPWRMKQMKKSQCYTTSWHELLTITL